MKTIKELAERNFRHDKIKIETLIEVSNLIRGDIEFCKKNCFCKVMNIKIEGLVSSQKICGHCHAKDQLEELKQRIDGK